MAIQENISHVNLGNLPGDIIWTILSFTEARDLDNFRLISSQWNSIVVEYRRIADLDPVRSLWWTVRPNPPYPKERNMSRELFVGFSEELEQLNYETSICASTIFRGRRHFDHLIVFMPEIIPAPNTDSDSNAIRGISAAMEGVTIGAIEFFRVPCFDMDRFNIVKMVRAHATRSIELSSERADTANLCSFFISLADSGVKTIKLKALKNEPFLGQHITFWEQSALELSRASPFEFTTTLNIGSIFDLVLVKITRRRTIIFD
ncbi:hypothetical protein PRIPAC_88095 [Pristionchus pacificus]|uniref:F-box domain-containing protein n=1 Tax=Pristionchus pacificus TaxID=54126 RepID=A0A2A6B5R9_PRIPA|nr:hypothetical protein PRIPAC_88095 [Pristionchus pacificus]|eukprot:PDM61203.1 hypothetical protein PRIPAC_50645 [Pristionchus pacificus]